MEIECVNKCGNLTDSPRFDKCESCREMENLPEERKLLNIILKHLDDAEIISPNVVMSHNYMEISHKHKKYKITVDLLE